MAENPETLFIFVTSDRPDVYINTTYYCVEHYGIKEIIYLGITKDKLKESSEEEYLKSVRQRVIDQLTGLKDGKYSYWDKDERRWKDKVVDVSTHYRSKYAAIAMMREPQVEVLVYDKLEAEIKEFLRIKGSDCIFDVSAISKSYLVDVYTLLLSQGASDIYAFELRKRPDFDERDLIHKLSIDEGNYGYVKMTESSYTLGTAIKSKHELEKLRQVDEAAHTVWEMFRKALAKIADEFSVVALWVYGLMVITSAVLLVYYVAKNKWDQIEPKMFILFLPLLPYSIEVIAYAIFRKEVSLKPHFLYEWLRKRKLKSVEAEFDVREKGSFQEFLDKSPTTGNKPNGV
ncbi:MAG: hypothetical protein M3X11_11865 [Acidobacteriota bacterium]|nr:hypothetical protein [Acidobacteriota bacterium]